MDRSSGSSPGRSGISNLARKAVGWVFALTVDPAIRVNSIGTQLFDEMCRIFTQAGVRKVRTMIEHDNQLVMAFFRGQGLMVGRFIGMEKNLD